MPPRKRPSKSVPGGAPASEGYFPYLHVFTKIKYIKYNSALCVCRQAWTAVMEQVIIWTSSGGVWSRPGQ